MKNKKEFFYEVVSVPGFDAVVAGPLKYMRYVSSIDGKNSEFKYAQVVNGQVVQTFRKNEIFVTNKNLGKL